MGILAMPYEKDTVGIRTPFHWRNATPLIVRWFFVGCCTPTIYYFRPITVC